MDFKWFLTGTLDVRELPCNTLRDKYTQIPKRPLLIHRGFFLDFLAYFFGGISTRRLHFYLLLINNCRKMKKKLLNLVFVATLFPPFRCWRGGIASTVITGDMGNCII